MESTQFSNLGVKYSAALHRWLEDERGVTAIEYGLLAALIAVACIAAISATGTSLSGLYTVWTSAVLNAI